jgi:tripartite-type tricarboxylate transporter receptor subunit TctC
MIVPFPPGGVMEVARASRSSRWPTGSTPILMKLREAVRAVATSPGFKNAMEKVSTPVSYRDAPQFAEYWERDARRLAAAVEKIGKVEEAKK